MPTGTKSNAIPPILWEPNPEWGDPDRHGFCNYTKYGYIANGKKRITYLAKNQAAISKELGYNWHYPYSGVVTCLLQKTIPEYRKIQKAIEDTMASLGFSANVETEINKLNQVHFHLTFRHFPEAYRKNNARRLRDALRKAVPVKLNQRYRPLETYKDATRWINYNSKQQFFDSKQEDPDQPTNTDIYADRRVLFKKPPKGTRGLNRFSAFGDFWKQKPKESQAQYTAKKRQRKANRKANPNAQEAAKELAVLTGKENRVLIIEDSIHKDLEKATPNDKQRLEQQNKDLSEQHHGGAKELAQHQREQEEQEARQEASRAKSAATRAKKRQAKQAKKPWTPADSEILGVEGADLNDAKLRGATDSRKGILPYRRTQPLQRCPTGRCFARVLSIAPLPFSGESHD